MAKNYEVRISGFAYDQQNISISSGDTVTWINLDDSEHTVTTDSGSALSISEVTLDGGQFSERIPFSSAGVLKYHCEIHPHMKGSVTVA
jgi:plastocyanin